MTVENAHTAHIPVLKNEVLQALIGAPDGSYVDATFGRGGHSRALLDALGTNARLLAIDRDPEAIEVADALACDDRRVTVRHGRFGAIGNILQDADFASVDGILMDVGVSSPQLDDARRGFSFLNDGPLDMRMDPSSGRSAAEWLNDVSTAELETVLRDFGEERYARRIARAIVAARPLATTAELAAVVEQAVPGANAPGKHKATRTFQAIRIKINAETEELEDGLNGAFASLKVGGRLAVIAFHSLEDRAVKRKFNALSSPPELPRRLPVRASEHRVEGKVVAGPLRAGPAEVAANPRSRSATLRVIERVADAEE